MFAVGNNYNWYASVPLYIYSTLSSLKYIKNKVPNICDRYRELYFLVSLIANYAPGEIAPEGQTSAHVPQSTQTSGSIEYFAPSEIAPVGHSSMQVPQAMQSSLITYAIILNF